MNKLFKFYFLLLIPVLSIMAVSCDDDDGNYPSPTITNVSPNAGPPGSTVTISGTNLSETSSVTFGNTDAIDMIVAEDNISATVPPIGTGEHIIRVTTPGGIATASFTVR